MNDDSQVVNQNTDPVSAAPVQSQASQPAVQPIQPVAPVGSTNKEVEPIVSPVSEFVKPSETEPQIDKDIAELGVEAKKESPQLTDEHRQAGIDHAGIYTPVPSNSTGLVKMPMSDEEVAEKLKTGQNDDSGKWLAGLINKVIAVMGIKLS